MSPDGCAVDTSPLHRITFTDSSNLNRDNHSTWTPSGIRLKVLYYVNTSPEDFVQLFERGIYFHSQGDYMIFYK